MWALENALRLSPLENYALSLVSASHLPITVGDCSLDDGDTGWWMSCQNCRGNVSGTIAVAVNDWRCKEGRQKLGKDVLADLLRSIAYYFIEEGGALQIYLLGTKRGRIFGLCHFGSMNWIGHEKSED
jgi:hypothetical protein